MIRSVLDPAWKDGVRADGELGGAKEYTGDNKKGAILFQTEDEERGGQRSKDLWRKKDKLAVFKFLREKNTYSIREIDVIVKNLSQKIKKKKVRDTYTEEVPTRFWHRLLWSPGIWRGRCLENAFHPKKNWTNYGQGNL